MEKNRPRVGISTYILNGKKQLLLMKRKGSTGEGTWCTPGGKLDSGESFFHCAKRETEEETGLKIIKAEVIGVSNDISSIDNHWITVSVKAISWEGEPKIMEPHKCSEIGWFGLDNLPEPLFLPTINFMNSYKNQLP